MSLSVEDLKPNTRLYPFFDSIDMSKYVVPKLIEITMVSGTFGAGEVVEGSRPNTNNDAIRFRLANQNHKYGPYNNPSQVTSRILMTLLLVSHLHILLPQHY